MQRPCPYLSTCSRSLRATTKLTYSLGISTNASDAKPTRTLNSRPLAAAQRAHRIEKVARWEMEAQIEQIFGG